MKKGEVIKKNLLLDLELVEKMIWNLFLKGTNDKTSSYHAPTLGTTKNNKTFLRTLILRKVEKNKKTILFYTDNRSKKFADIFYNNHVTVHVYDIKKKIQIQCYGKAMIYKNNKQAKLIWNNLSEHSKSIYMSTITPGKKINSINNDLQLIDKESSFSNFGLIKIIINKIEYLQLKRGNNIRALFSYKGSECNIKLLAP